MKAGKSRAQAGVTLLEFVLYLGIFFVLIATSFYWMSTICIPCVHDIKKMRTSIETHTAIHLLRQEIKVAPVLRSRWKKITESELIWHHADEDIGWQLKQGMLFRVQGIYNMQQERWEKRVTSLATPHMQEVHFNVIGNEKHVSHVDLVCRQGTQHAVYTMVVCNRIIA